MAERSAYAILGLQKGATEQEIKLAFVEMVKKYDPEVHTDRFLLVQNAYNRLKDPKKRAKEDIHTYSVITGEFLFAGDERVDENSAPSDSQVNQAMSAHKNSAGDPALRDKLIRLLMQRSWVAAGRKMWAEAITDWKEIRSMDPTHVRARTNLTNANIQLGLSYALHSLHDEAISLWEEALELNPDNADLVHNLALACEKAGEGTKAARYWAEAVERWKKLLKSDNDNEYLRECIVEAHRYHGGQFNASTSPEEKSQAINRYREVLELKPNDFDAQFHIANSLMEERKYPEAIKELEDLHKKHMRNVEVLNLLGWAFVNTGRVDQGFATWNKSLGIDPKNPATKENIVRAHLTLGKQFRDKGMFTPAIVHLKKLLRYVQSAEVYMEIGATYDMKGDVRSAMQAYEQVLSIDPKHKAARKAFNDLRMRR